MKQKLWLAFAVAALGCGQAAAGENEGTAGTAASSTVASAASTATAEGSSASSSVARPEPSLGVADRGIWSDLDGSVQLALPAGVDAARVTATIDREHRLLVVYVDGWPTKPYPLGGDATLVVGDHRLALRPGDRAELAPLLAPGRVREARADADLDGDGIPDPLDVLLGARKTVLNGDAYVSGYRRLAYPMGDVPRTIGVCTDVIVRSLRNAGLDLQVELQRDLHRARAAYPMVKGAGDPNIDQRRVKTLLPWFLRHLDRRSPKLDDPDDPLRPGDIVLFDTFPSRSGPDHIGIVSDRAGDHGLPLVINNWTEGTVTTEMDLLGWVPVLYRFRVR
ncbi:MAG TPA: DUF1287 domain-containing protein [Kofleriaceae bacterium]|nr:DUF1287 domain-containing protein [Kofleriaceae bacterium]